MSNDGTIHARAIRKSFGPKTVLKDIDLDISSGEICCIIGPSGSGKSTVLRCINGLETVDSGVLKVNGEDFGYFETDSLPEAQARMAATEVNARWQAEMAGFFEDLDGAPDEGFLQLTEVFNLEDHLASSAPGLTHSKSKGD